MLRIKGAILRTMTDQEQSSTSIFSIEPLNLDECRYIKVDKTLLEFSLSDTTNECVNKPL